MSEQYKDVMVCKRVRRNNGVVETFFTRHPSSQSEPEEHALFNLSGAKWDAPEEGKMYRITIEPAFPHSD